MLAAPNGESASFYVAGGTLPAEAISYVHRSADEALFNALVAGQFCYVLNSRQMGKSSICVRTMGRLEAAGVWTAFVDLTKIGGKNVTPEQWYAGVAMEIGRSLELRREVMAYWKDQAHLGPMQRFFGVLRDVLMAHRSTPVAIFFDEIDATRSLSFSADEFFAGIRECYNRRVQDPAFSRLTFCLLGVAVPSDLISNPNSTPFNIGERVYLKDFTLNEAMSLASGLPGDGAVLLQRVYHWTNGHPYLTQSLCAAIVADPSIKTPADVDELVRRELLDPKSRDSNINLADVANRALHAGDNEPDPIKFRADLLSAYETAWKGKPLRDDESNRVASLLKLSGLMQTDQTRLRLRNRIYEHVFGRDWIRENMPGQEVKRQRWAYSLGVLRTALIGALVIVMVAWLAWKNSRLFHAAELARHNAEYESYVADVNFMRTAAHDNDNMSLARLLDKTYDSPFKNLEWWYWFGQLHDSDLELGLPNGIGSVDLSPGDGSLLIQDPNLGWALYSYPGLKEISKKASKADSMDAGWVEPGQGIGWLGGGWKTLDRSPSGQLVVKDYPSGDALQTLQLPDPNVQLFCSHDGSFLAGEYHNRVFVWNAKTLKQVGFVKLPGQGAFSPTVSNDGKLIAYDEVPTASRSSRSAVVINVETAHVVDVYRFSSGGPRKLALSDDSRYLALPTVSGRLVVRQIQESKTVLDKQVSSSALTRASFSSSGHRLLTVGTDLVARVWDVESGVQIGTEKGAIDACLSSDGKAVAVAGQGTRIYPVGFLRGNPSHPMKGLSVATGTNDATEVVVLNGTTLRLLDGVTLKQNKEISLPTGPKGAYATDGGVYSFSLGSDNGATLYEVATAQKICHIDHCDPDWAPTVSASLKLIFILDELGTTVHCYDFGGVEKWSRTLKAPAYGPVRLAPGGHRLAVGMRDGKIFLLQAANGKDMGQLMGPQGEIRCMAFSAKGRYLAAGSADHQCYIYDLSEQRPPVVCYGHSGYVRWVAFSRDGERILTASQDGTARLWNSHSGQELLQLGDHGPDLRTAIFSRDGNRIYTSDEASDGEVQAYTIPVGRLVKQIR